MPVRSSMNTSLLHSQHDIQTLRQCPNKETHIPLFRYPQFRNILHDEANEILVEFLADEFEK